ncbi:MAG: DUF177 domain-containing protein [Armatimonadetes bacterium]|nr:DUF177 domain-containing protein [Armatimonadota bacterium]
MKLDLTEIVAHLGKRIRYDIDEPAIEDLGGDVAGVSSMTGQVTFTNTGRHLVTRGSFQAVVELECSRCLRKHRVELDLPIEEELPIAGRIVEPGGEEIVEELPEEEKEPLFVDGIFDLTEFLRQTILVALPIKPLCSEQCLGLCPRCGKNLNDGPCECPTDVEAGPFAALAELMEEDEET